MFPKLNISPDNYKQGHSVKVQNIWFYYDFVYFNAFPNINNELSLLPWKVNRQFTFQVQSNEKLSKYFDILMSLGISGYRPATNRK